MSVGRVKWYDKSKGYGFIESPQGDVFFHFSDILMEGFKALAEDQRVSYKLVRSKDGLKAKQIRPLDTRATVRHAARYRTLIHMRIRDDREADFDKFFLEIPAWFDSMEQDLGLRRIGTWRNGLDAVHLVESDRPYEQSIDAADAKAYSQDFQQWQEALMELLVGEQVIMKPIQTEAPLETEDDSPAEPPQDS